MAKANPASGTSYYLPDGAPVPDEIPAGIRLVGPGAPDDASEAGPPPIAPASEDANDTDQEVEVVEDVASDDYDAMVLEELRDHLRARDLPVSGNKADLVARLRENDAEEG